MTPDAFFRDYIRAWEGGLSLDPDDAGNWYGGLVVGSKYGVTAAALSAWRKTANITAQDIRDLTLDEAVQIAQRLYYEQPRFNRLPWDPVIASAVDFGWGAGPTQAIKSLQRMVGTDADAQIGPATDAAYRAAVARAGIEGLAVTWQRVRDDFYRMIVERRPVNAKYLKGWMNRSAYFAPGSDWWARFTRGQAA